ncbi:MAG: energy transducer TonB [Bacteroidota bacterium]
MIQDTQNTNRPLALMITVLFHGIVFLILFFFVLHTPNPPYPLVGGGSGLEVNFGTSDEGTGTTQPEEYLAVETKNISQVSGEAVTSDQKSGQDEQILTQETEESVAVKTSKKPDAKKVTTAAIKINDPVVNPNALFKKKNKGGSEGETGKPGDQGNPEGSMYAKNHYGTPGSGDGTGEGFGKGTGAGNGSGASFNLNGRTAKYLPKPEYNLREQGTVVVKIWVSKEGLVSRAEAGARGTTTSSDALFKLATKAALKAKFSSNTDAPEEQKGTITYHFVLQN